VAELVVRVFNVGFGDATLVSVPEGSGANTVTRHVLFDLGNSLADEGSDNAPFEVVLDAIDEILGGEPLDLYVMTHEHMDHVQGPLYLKQKRPPGLAARHVWMTASAEGDAYYGRFPSAEKERSLAVDRFAALKGIAQLLAADDELIKTMLWNNGGLESLGLSSGVTADCVDAIRGLADEGPHYMFHGADLEGTHPFEDAQLSIWGPEEDTSIYYGRFRPLAFNAEDVESGTRNALVRPPPGVDAGAFYDLVERRENGWVESLLAIDRAANNTSLVVALEWEGWRLLFPGDAERRAWKEMDKRSLLQPVHFLKVSHHGSENGTPIVDLLEKVMPAAAPDGRPRFAAISTHHDAYSGVPDDATRDLLAERCSVASTEPLDPGTPLEYRFSDDGTATGPDPQV
jgi:hypothetical protein